MIAIVVLANTSTASYNYHFVSTQIFPSHVHGPASQSVSFLILAKELADIEHLTFATIL